MEAANDTAKDQISLASLLRQVLESQVCLRAAEAQTLLSTSARLVDETEPSTILLLSIPPLRHHGGGARGGIATDESPARRRANRE